MADEVGNDSVKLLLERSLTVPREVCENFERTRKKLRNAKSFSERDRPRSDSSRSDGARATNQMRRQRPPEAVGLEYCSHIERI